MRCWRVTCICAVLGCAVFSSSSASAHPAHTSLVEIELLPSQNGQQILEVSWDLERQDLELYLAMQNQEHVVFDESNRFHKLLLLWLEKNFVLSHEVSSKDSPRVTTSKTVSFNEKNVFSFVGKELGATRVILFFSVGFGVEKKKRADKLEDVFLEVPALLHVDETYVNLVNIRRCVSTETSTQSFRFDAEHLEPQLLIMRCTNQKRRQKRQQKQLELNIDIDEGLEQKAKDQAAKDQAAKDQAAKDQAAKDQAAKTKRSRPDAHP
ncbi:MAG: hypothetical protein GY822_12110 [Deltaproteobacteria bacterium]|nr:hypothetical protein [Deltaproteobacteria bacterium]